MPEPHQRRRAALRRELRAGGLDGLLVVDLRNIRYLTGFTGSNAALLVYAPTDSDAGTVLCTDGRYLTQSEREVPDLERVIDRPCDSVLVTLASKRSVHYRQVGFESQHVTVDRLDALTEAAQSVRLVRRPGLVEKLRMVKDDTEIEALRMACAAADRALAALIEHGGLRAGRTRAVARPAPIIRAGNLLRLCGCAGAGEAVGAGARGAGLGAARAAASGAACGRHRWFGGKRGL